MGSLFTLISVTHVGQVHFFYRATLTSNQFDPGIESQEVELFTEREIPWDELAFRTVKDTLALYFKTIHEAPTHDLHELVIR
jgi:hypothetical protein